MIETSSPPVRVELGGDGVLRVTLDRPSRRNALTLESFALIEEAYGPGTRRSGARCVSLSGAGASFCAGLDRALLASFAGAEAGPGAEEGLRLQAAVDAIEACPLPTLAAIQGACVGGGAALLLACDLRIASEDAFVALMEMRYGFLPDLGHIHRLRREVGLARLKEALFFGDRLPAATLASWGVVNEVVSDAEALAAAAARWERRCVAAPPLAVAEAKRLLLADPTGAAGDAAQTGALRANLDRLLPSADFREGLGAALEGRPPRFRGE